MGVFLSTLAFLFSTPGIVVPSLISPACLHARSVSYQRFVLLGAALWTLGDACGQFNRNERELAVFYEAARYGRSCFCQRGCRKDDSTFRSYLNRCWPNAPPPPRLLVENALKPRGRAEANEPTRPVTVNEGVEFEQPETCQLPFTDLLSAIQLSIGGSSSA